jgi:ribonuclease HII
MIYATFDDEKILWDQGYQAICGIDEVGRGCFAGPLLAGAVIYPPHFKTDEKIADSKKLTKLQKNHLSKYIKENALAYGIGTVEVAEINELGLTAAQQLAYQRAVQNLPADFYMIDAVKLDHIPTDKQLHIIRGDVTSISIASGAIIAKVERDALMTELAKDYPEYGFDNHVGYGTLQHRQAIFQHGLTPLHRTIFKLDKFCA